MYLYLAGTLASLCFCPPECHLEERTDCLLFIEPSEVFRGRFILFIRRCLILNKSFVFLGSYGRTLSYGQVSKVWTIFQGPSSVLLCHYLMDGCPMDKCPQ